MLITEWSALFKTPNSLVLAIFWVKRTQRVHKTQRSWSKTTFAPTLEYQRKIITYLLNKEIIFISPDTSIESITIENNCITKFINWA